MNTRPITEDDLHAYVDRLLDSTRQAEVADYLAGHPAVARQVEGYLRQREDLRALHAQAVEEPLPPELNLGRMIERRRQPGRVSWRAGVAAALLLLAGGAGGWLLHGTLRPPAEGIAALAREAADSYAVYAPDRIRPVELRAADSAELLGWASRRLDRPLAVPDLSASGYRFMGGRLVATPHGPAVLFMYDDDRGTRLVLLVRAMKVEWDAPPTRHSRGPVAGVAWADSGMGYSLAGPAAPEVLDPLAEEVRRQVGGSAAGRPLTRG